MKVCAKCGTKLDKKDVFCGNCGSNEITETNMFGIKVPQKNKKCLNCGETLEQKAKFCWACGKPCDGVVSLAFLDGKTNSSVKQDPAEDEVELDFLKSSDAFSASLNQIDRVESVQSDKATGPVSELDYLKNRGGYAAAQNTANITKLNDRKPDARDFAASGPTTPQNFMLAGSGAGQPGATSMFGTTPVTPQTYARQNAAAAAPTVDPATAMARAAELEAQRREEAARRAQEEALRLAEEARLASEAAKRAEEERIRAEEERKRLEEEQRKRAEEAARLAEEERKRAEEERKRREEEEARRLEEERRRIEEETARRLEEERKRAEEEERRRKEEEARRAEEERKRKEEEERRRKEEEERKRAEEEAARKAAEERRKELEALCKEVDQRGQVALTKAEKDEAAARTDLEAALDGYQDYFKKAEIKAEESDVAESYYRIEEILGAAYYKEKAYKLASPMIKEAAEHGRKRARVFYADWMIRNRKEIPAGEDYLVNYLEEIKNDPEITKYEQERLWLLYLLGRIYQDGITTEKNPQAAVGYYKECAEHGDVPSMARLGNSYFYGEGVKKDLAEALKWNQKAAEEGNEGGIRNMALTYDYGRGVPKDAMKAVEWYKKLLEMVSNDRFAMYRIAYCLCDPEKEYRIKPTEEMYREALGYAERAKQEGDHNADYILGFYHTLALDGGPDYDKAAALFANAANHGNDKARQWLTRFVKTGSGHYSLR